MMTSCPLLLFKLQEMPHSSAVPGFDKPIRSQPACSLYGLINWEHIPLKSLFGLSNLMKQFGSLKLHSPVVSLWPSRANSTD